MVTLLGLGELLGHSDAIFVETMGLFEGLKLAKIRGLEGIS